MRPWFTLWFIEAPRPADQTPVLMCFGGWLYFVSWDSGQTWAVTA